MAQLVKHLFASIDGETIEQRALELAWLELIRDHIMTSCHIERDNLDSQTRVYLVDALTEITAVLEEEAERQHLDRSYPEGGF